LNWFLMTKTSGLHRTSNIDHRASSRLLIFAVKSLALTLSLSIILTMPGTTAWADDSAAAAAPTISATLQQKYSNEVNFTGKQPGAYIPIMPAASQVGTSATVQTATALFKLAAKGAQMAFDPGLSPAQLAAKTQMLASVGSHDVTPMVNGSYVNPTGGSGALDANSISGMAIRNASDLLLGSDGTTIDNGAWGTTVGSGVGNSAQISQSGQTQTTTYTPGDLSNVPTVDVSEKQLNLLLNGDGKPLGTKDKTYGIDQLDQATVDKASGLYVQYQSQYEFLNDQYWALKATISSETVTRSKLINDVNTYYSTGESIPESVQDAKDQIQKLTTQLNTQTSQLAELGQSRDKAQAVAQTMTNWLDWAKKESSSNSKLDFNTYVPDPNHPSDRENIHDAIEQKRTDMHNKKGTDETINLGFIDKHAMAIAGIGTALLIVAMVATLPVSATVLAVGGTVAVLGGGALGAVADAQRNGLVESRNELASTKSFVELGDKVKQFGNAKSELDQAQGGINRASDAQDQAIIQQYALGGERAQAFKKQIDAKTALLGDKQRLDKLISDVKALSSNPNWRNGLVQIVKELGDKKFADQMQKLSPYIKIDDAVKMLQGYGSAAIVNQAKSLLISGEKVNQGLDGQLNSLQDNVKIARNAYALATIDIANQARNFSGRSTDNPYLAALVAQGSSAFDRETGSLLDNQTIGNYISDPEAAGHHAYTDYANGLGNAYGFVYDRVLAPINAIQNAYGASFSQYPSLDNNIVTSSLGHIGNAALAGFDSAIGTGFSFLTDIPRVVVGAGSFVVGSIPSLFGGEDWENWKIAGLNQIDNSIAVKLFAGSDSQLVRRYYNGSDGGSLSDLFSSKPISLGSFDARYDSNGNFVGLQTGNDYLNWYLSQGMEKEFAANRPVDSYADVLSEVDVKKNAAWLGSDSIAAFRQGDLATALAKGANGVLAVAGQTYVDMAAFGGLNSVLATVDQKILRETLQYALVKIPGYQFSFNVANDLSSLASGNTERMGEGMVDLGGLFLGSAGLASTHAASEASGAWNTTKAFAADLLPHFTDDGFKIGSIIGETAKMGIQGAFALVGGGLGAVMGGQGIEDIAKAYGAYAQKQAIQLVDNGMPAVDISGPSIDSTNHDTDIFGYLKSLGQRIGEWARSSLPQTPDLQAALANGGSMPVDFSEPLQLAETPNTTNLPESNGSGTPELTPRAANSSTGENAASRQIYEQIAQKIDGPNILEQIAGARKLSANQIQTIATNINQLQGAMGILNRDYNSTLDQPGINTAKPDPVSIQEARAFLDYAKGNGKLAIDDDGNVTLGGQKLSPAMAKSPLVQEALAEQKSGTSAPQTDIVRSDLQAQHDTHSANVLGKDIVSPEQVSSAQGLVTNAEANRDLARLQGDPLKIRAADLDVTRAKINATDAIAEFARFQAKGSTSAQELDARLEGLKWRIKLAQSTGQDPYVIDTFKQEAATLASERQGLNVKEEQGKVDALESTTQKLMSTRDQTQDTVIPIAELGQQITELKAQIKEATDQGATPSTELTDRLAELTKTQADRIDAAKNKLGLSADDPLAKTLDALTNTVRPQDVASLRDDVAMLNERMGRVDAEKTAAATSLQLAQHLEKVLTLQADPNANEDELTKAQDTLQQARAQQQLADVKESATKRTAGLEQQKDQLQAVSTRINKIQDRLGEIDEENAQAEKAGQAISKNLQAEEAALHAELRAYRTNETVWTDATVQQTMANWQEKLENTTAAPNLVDGNVAVDLARAAIESQLTHLDYHLDVIRESAAFREAQLSDPTLDITTLEKKQQALLVARDQKLQDISNGAQLSADALSKSERSLASREISAWTSERSAETMQYDGVDIGNMSYFQAVAEGVLQRTFVDQGIGTGLLDSLKALWNKSDILDRAKQDAHEQISLADIVSRLPEPVQRLTEPLRSMFIGEPLFQLVYEKPDTEKNPNALTDATVTAKLKLAFTPKAEAEMAKNEDLRKQLETLRDNIQTGLDRIAKTTGYTLLHGQVMNLLQAVATGRTFTIAPTGTGKTKVLTFGDAYLMKQIYGKNMGKVTVAMPDVNLMGQALKDVKSLYQKVGWNVESVTGEDFANGSALGKIQRADVVFTTRQTLQELHMEVTGNGEVSGDKAEAYRLLTDKGLLMQDEAHQLRLVDLIQGGNPDILRDASKSTYDALVRVDGVLRNIYENGVVDKDGQTVKTWNDYEEFYHNYLNDSKNGFIENNEFTDKFLKEVYAPRIATDTGTNLDSVLDRLRNGTDADSNRDKLALRAFAEAITAGHAVEGGYGLDRDEKTREVLSSAIKPISLGKEARNMFFGDKWQAGARQIVGARALAARGLLDLHGEMSAEDLLKYAKTNGSSARVTDVGPTSMFTYIVQFTGTPGEVMHREALTHGLFTPADVGDKPTLKYGENGMNKIRTTDQEATTEFVTGKKNIKDFGDYLATQVSDERPWLIVPVESSKIHGFEVSELAKTDGFKNQIVLVQRGPSVDVYEYKNSQWVVNKDLKSDDIANFFKEDEAQKYYLNGQTLGADGRVDGKGIVVILDGPGSTGTDIQFKFMKVGEAIESLKRLVNDPSDSSITEEDRKNFALDPGTRNALESAEDTPAIQRRLNELQVAETLSRIVQGRYVSDEMLSETKGILQSWVDTQDPVYQAHAQNILDAMGKASFENGLTSARETVPDIAAKITPLAREVFRSVFQDYLKSGPKFITATGSETNDRGGVQAPGRDRGLGTVAAFGYHDKAIVPIGEGLAETAEQHIATLEEKGEKQNKDVMYRGVSGDLTQMKFSDLSYIVKNEQTRLRAALEQARAVGLWDGNLQQGLANTAENVIQQAGSQRSVILDNLKEAKRGLDEILQAQREFERKVEEATVTLGQKSNATAAASLEGDVTRLQEDFKRVTADRTKYFSKASQEFVESKNAHPVKLTFSESGKGISRVQFEGMSDSERQAALAGGEGRGFLGLSFEQAVTNLGRLERNALDFEITAPRSTAVTIAETKVGRAVEQMRAAAEGTQGLSDSELLDVKRAADRAGRSPDTSITPSPAVALVAAVGNSPAAIRQALKIAANVSTVVTPETAAALGASSTFGQARSAWRGFVQDYKETRSGMDPETSWKPFKVVVSAMSQVNLRNLSDSTRFALAFTAYHGVATSVATADELQNNAIANLAILTARNLAMQNPGNAQFPASFAQQKTQAESAEVRAHEEATLTAMHKGNNTRSGDQTVEDDGGRVITAQRNGRTTIRVDVENLNEDMGIHLARALEHAVQGNRLAAHLDLPVGDSLVKVYVQLPEDPQAAEQVRQAVKKAIGDGASLQFVTADNKVYGVDQTAEQAEHLGMDEVHQVPVASSNFTPRLKAAAAKTYGAREANAFDLGRVVTLQREVAGLRRAARNNNQLLKQQWDELKAQGMSDADIQTKLKDDLAASEMAHQQLESKQAELATETKRLAANAPALHRAAVSGLLDVDPKIVDVLAALKDGNSNPLEALGKLSDATQSDLAREHLKRAGGNVYKAVANGAAIHFSPAEAAPETTLDAFTMAYQAVVVAEGHATDSDLMGLLDQLKTDPAFTQPHSPASLKTLSLTLMQVVVQMKQHDPARGQVLERDIALALQVAFRTQRSASPYAIRGGVLQVLNVMTANRDALGNDVLAMLVPDDALMDALNLWNEISKILPGAAPANFMIVTQSEQRAYHAALEDARTAEVDRVLASLSPVFKPQEAFASTMKTSGLIAYAVGVAVSMTPLGRIGAIVAQVFGTPLVNKLLGGKPGPKFDLKSAMKNASSLMGDSFGISNAARYGILFAVVLTIIAASSFVASMGALAGSIVGFVTLVKAAAGMAGLIYSVALKASLAARVADFVYSAYQFKKVRFAETVSPTTQAQPQTQAADVVDPSITALVPAQSVDLARPNPVIKGLLPAPEDVPPLIAAPDADGNSGLLEPPAIPSMQWLIPRWASLKSVAASAMGLVYLLILISAAPTDANAALHAAALFHSPLAAFMTVILAAYAGIKYFHSDLPGARQFRDAGSSSAEYIRSMKPMLLSA